MKLRAGTYPLGKLVKNGIYGEEPDKIEQHLPFDEIAGRLKNGLEHALDLLKFYRLPTVKGDAFTVLLDS